MTLTENDEIIERCWVILCNEMDHVLQERVALLLCNLRLGKTAWTFCGTTLDLRHSLSARS